MYDIEFTIREPKVPWLNKILFSALFSGFCILVIYVFSNDIDSKLTSGDKTQVYTYLIILLGIFIMCVLPIISKNYVHLNFTNFKIKYSYSIGIFIYNEKWQDLNHLNYISVFHTENGYEINLWYKNNKILNLFALEDFDEAIEKGFFFSEKLNIDLLDARKRGCHKWVNKTIYKETNTVAYLD